MMTSPEVGRDRCRARPLTIFVPHASDCFTDHLAHGDGLVAFEFARRLAERGHTVHVAAPKIDVEAAVPPTLHFHETAIAGRHPRLRYMVAVRRLFDRLHTAQRFDIVHQLNPVFTGISLAFAGTHVPVVLGSFLADWPHVHGRRSTRMRIAANVKRRIASLQQRHARVLIVTTPGARARIVDPVRNVNKIVQLPHGIDPTLYTPSFRPVTAAPTILFLGGLEERKGIFTLLDAFPLVRAAIPTCRLVVGGAGAKWSGVDQRIRELPEPGAVSLLGRVRRADVPTLLASATVFAMPSLGEPFGMSLLEAMACGKPVVVTDAGGPQHIVDENGGRKVPPEHPGALAEALIEILRSPELQVRMGAHNRARIEDVYGWDRVIDRLEDLYRSILEPVVAE